jgi:hypothetical protein
LTAIYCAPGGSGFSAGGIKCSALGITCSALGIKCSPGVEHGGGGLRFELLGHGDFVLRRRLLVDSLTLLLLDFRLRALHLQLLLGAWRLLCLLLLLSFEHIDDFGVVVDA